MHELLNGLEYVRANTDDLLIISNKSKEKYIKKLDRVLTKLKAACFKKYPFSSEINWTI